MDKSPLQKLPGELRNQIYRLALLQPDFITLYSHEPTVFVDSEIQTSVKNALSLLSTCKQVREEALPIFFAENSFEVYTWILVGNQDRVTRNMSVTRSSIGEWLLSLGTSARHIRQVTCYLGGWSASYPPHTWVTEAIVRAMQELRALLVSTSAALEVRVKCRWADASRYHNEISDAPVVPLTFSNGKMARMAVAEAFQDEDELVKRSTPKPGEDGYGRVEFQAETRKKDLRHSREQAEILIEKLESTFGS